MQSWHPAAWMGLNGASEAPKSTVPAEICAMPVPEPTGLKLTALPVLLDNAEPQSASRGATRVEPAPLSVPPAAEAAPVEMKPVDAPAASMAAESDTSFLSWKAQPFK